MNKLITGLLIAVILLLFAEISISSDEEPIIGWDGKPVPGKVTKSTPGENLSSPGAIAESTREGYPSCYDLGYRYGRCASMILVGRTCDPSDDIIIPEQCRHNKETQRGINDGVRSVLK